MTFEEEFPELKESLIEAHDGTTISFKLIIKDIQKHCVSKQRVRDAIEKKLKFLNYILEKDVPDIDKLVNQLGVNVAIINLKELIEELNKEDKK